MWQDEADLTLDQTNCQIQWGGEKEKGGEERKRKEKLQLLSTIYGDRWVGFRRANN